MRPVFLPDGSLLLGQTGRGWQAKGGKVAALQHVTWDGKTVAPQIVAMIATPQGFRIDLTQPLGDGVSEAILRAALSLESWTYRDAPDYGSPELDLHDEGTTALAISADRKSVDIKLASIEQKVVHPRQTARVYHAKLASQTLFDANCAGGAQCVLHTARVSGDDEVINRRSSGRDGRTVQAGARGGMFGFR